MEHMGGYMEEVSSNGSFCSRMFVYACALQSHLLRCHKINLAIRLELALSFWYMWLFYWGVCSAFIALEGPASA